MTANNQYGIVQGRLIQSPPDELQWFPQNYWESEFFIAASLEIKYIELIAERAHNPKNPIWTDDGIAKIKELCKRNNLSRYAICNDYIIDHNLIGEDSSAVFDQMQSFLQRAISLDMKIVVLPFFEESELNSANEDLYIPVLKKIADIAKSSNILLCLETVMNGSELINLFKKLNHSHVKCVFDTGNRVAFKHDIYSDIRLLKQHIAHVHIKDKNVDNKNVLLGEGLVNFHEVFRALSDIDYQGNYTFETHRGNNPFATAKFHMELCSFCAQDAGK